MILGTAGTAPGTTVAGIIGVGDIIPGTMAGILPIIGDGVITTPTVGTIGIGMATTIQVGTGLIVRAQTILAATGLLVGTGLAWHPIAMAVVV